MSGVHRPALLGLTSAAAMLGSAIAIWRWAVTPDGWPPVLHGPLPALVGTAVAGTALLGVVMAWQLTVDHPATQAPERPLDTSVVPRPAEPEKNWWSQAAADGAPPPRPTAPASGGPTPAPQRPTAIAGSALIAQCPHCGDFRLDVHRDGHEYAFRCAEGCGHTWRWAPGSQWPPVVIRRIARDGSTHVKHRKAGI